MMKSIPNRKTATKLLLIQWSRFQNVCIKLDGSTLITGVNGTGKSTILDAMTYLLTGNTQFNKAAKDKDRTVKAYVRGDTKSNGNERYLRSGEVISYIAIEFWSPSDEKPFVAAVCIESKDEVSAVTSNWFVCQNVGISDINFAVIDGKKMLVTPKTMLSVKGRRLKSAEFMGRERGTEQILRAMGLRCDINKYRSKLVKMMAFDPSNNIDRFISECVLEPGKVNSLKELREQRDQFEHIKQIYVSLRDGKAKLEEVEKCAENYENRKRNLLIREMMLCYQELLAGEKEKEDVKFRIEALTQKISGLKLQQTEAERIFEDARKRLQAAESNDAYSGMKNSIRALENEIAELDRKIRQNEEDTAKLMHFQVSLSEELSWLSDGYGNDKEQLLHIAEAGFSEEKKREQLIMFLNYAEKRRQELEESRVHTKDRIEELKREVYELENKIKLLEANRLVFPEKVSEARQIIISEFEKKGIYTDVRIFAELVSEVKDASWRRAIETFLGRKRYFIIVDGKYCRDAMEILQNRKIHEATVVITDKLPDTETEIGSAAEQLVIPNVFARRYANYLLNGIHLCGTIDELHEYPKGGLMKNGMLAKSYAVSYMDIKNTELCLGQDAVEIQKKSAIEKRDIAKAEWARSLDSFEKITSFLGSLKKVNWNVKEYHLDAPDSLMENRTKRKIKEENIDNIKNNPDFLAVIEEHDAAEKAFREADEKRTEISNKIAVCEDECRKENEKDETLSEEIRNRKQIYEAVRTENLELEPLMISEYRKMRTRKDDVRVILPSTVQKLRTELDGCVKELETAQIEYCKISEIDINKRGTGYIPFYREEYRNLANVRIEEAHSRLEEQSRKLESAFMNDFVAEINETVGQARLEIEAINRELKQIPFGQDTYRFRMDEKPDRMLFFRICRKLQDYMNSAEVYMNSGREDEEMERDIQEFMNMILAEEDESEYTDYRKYFTYDMEITSRQGDMEITADLSKKQGSASNGEKQTPYFIILAASLLQCYPKNMCCARLAFIDEAFSTLSRERIEQMVKYLEQNNFQVIYAAPPEKIGSIGQFINSTVSLVPTGRYTDAIEGLVEIDEING
ncbi:MAG: SbcC/MukB-like Walker B domain-containing protein [Butyrivibrio sp.]